MDHGNMHNMPPPSSSSSSMANRTNSNMMVMHMTFFWGKNTEVLFTGGPGTSSGMYAPLCLIVVFFLAVIVEWLAHSPILRGRGSTSCPRGLAQTAVYTLKTCLAYLVMLAVMSFNAGVFIVAIAGFAVGFMLFGSTAFKKPSDDRKTVEIL